MDTIQKGSFSTNKIRYNIEVCFDQPYYYSSEKVRCYIKVNFQKNKDNSDINGNNELKKEDILDYITIQLYGFATYSNELLDNLNINTSYISVNQLLSNMISIGNRNNRSINSKSKTIFTSNPYILASNIKLDGFEGNIGSFTYTCYLPPFIPPTYIGRYISFNYIALITIGINNITNNTKFYKMTVKEKNEDELKTYSNFPIIQKKLKFDIKCLGPHPNSLKLQLNQFQYKIQHYLPITAIDNKNYIDYYYENNNTIEKIPSLTDTTITNSSLSDNLGFKVFNPLNNNDIIKNVLNIYNKKVSYLNKIMNQGELYTHKLRFFEKNNGNDVYNYLSNNPKSSLELLWENEIVIINYPKKMILNTNNNKTHTENLTINYKNKLVLNCNIKNLNNWSEKLPLILHFNFANCIWKTQEIHIIINRIENIDKNNDDEKETNTTVIYDYKRCNIWDLEFTHQIQPIFSNIIQSINTNSISIYYQLCIYFFIFDFKEEKKNVKYLDLNLFPNIIKLSWKSDKLYILPKCDQINYKYLDLFDPPDSINSENFNHIYSILPNNRIQNSKYIEF
ncbi:hypothetical protein FG386_001055 [Cryptosporidium ryanae]|uniref:uncharacterized protein n=1 Tax=Cryptosporidium ryanae TaxID=515981 RepID=UPI003519FD79|nr:hypothetical protein FG386_001055 [Cryptosporidium ryanae]